MLLPLSQLLPFADPGPKYCRLRPQPRLRDRDRKTSDFECGSSDHQQYQVKPIMAISLQLLPASQHPSHFTAVVRRNEPHDSG